MSTTEDPGEFLDHINSTPRKLGHNKLQTEINALHKEITELKVADGQKEVKLDLFKKTISNLQTQLQEKAARITHLEEEVNNNSDLEKLHDLNKLLVDKDKQLENLHSTLVELNTQLELRSTDIDELHKSIKLQTDTATSNSSEINALKVIIENQVQSINQFETDHLTLHQELQMKTNLVDNSQAELIFLRQELAVYKTRLDEQVQLIIETESELQKQLEFSKPQESPEDTTPRVIGSTKKKNPKGDLKKRR